MATSREKLELQRRMRLKVMLETLEQNKRLELSKAREEDDLSKMVLDLGVDAEDPEPELQELDEVVSVQEKDELVNLMMPLIRKSRITNSESLVDIFMDKYERTDVFIDLVQKLGAKEAYYEVSDAAEAAMEEVGGTIGHEELDEDIDDDEPDACSKCFGTKDVHACEQCKKLYCWDCGLEHKCPKEELDEGDVIHADFKNKKRLSDDDDDLSGLEIPGSKGGSVEKMDLEQDVWEKMFKLQAQYEYSTAGELVDEFVAQCPDLSDRAFEVLDDERLVELAQDVISSAEGSLGDDRELYEIVGPSDVATHDMHEEVTDEDPDDLDDLVSMLDSIVADRGGDIVDSTELVDAFKSDNPEKWEELVDKNDGDEEVAFNEVMDAANIALGNPADEEFDDSSMDGDAESALASAGLGTDEDYGDFGGEDMDEAKKTRHNPERKDWKGKSYKAAGRRVSDLDDLNKKQDWEDREWTDKELGIEGLPCGGLCCDLFDDPEETPCDCACHKDDLEEETSRQATWKRSRDRKRGLDEEHDTDKSEESPWPSPMVGEKCPDCGCLTGFSEEDCSCWCHEPYENEDEVFDEGSWSDIDISGEPKKKKPEEDEDEAWSDIEISKPKEKKQQSGAWSDLKSIGKGRIREASRLEYSKKKERK